jgi:SpoVK/Ycf46/Vps4 family AAA+-type ATPase
MDEVDHMQTWMVHQQEIKSIDHLKKRFRKGYRALFYGPPGTGKTLTASLLGNIHNRSVYRIDLSQIVSKYIGETEKNLSKIFDIAENKDWILFFDEAESLFAKRTDVSDSKDKFANQETSYLLQRIEDFDGMIILATNLKPNIDRAFIRRFQSIIHFTLPMPKERELLWRKALASFNVSSNIDYSDLAKRFEVSGGAINNAVQFAWLNAKRYGQDTIGADSLIHGIMRELGKEGKTSNT